MKQAYHSAGYKTFDLTECKIHRLVDKDTGKARFVLSYPKAWAPDDKMERVASANKRMTGRMYDVHEWEEVELPIMSSEGR